MQPLVHHSSKWTERRMPQCGTRAAGTNAAAGAAWEQADCRSDVTTGAAQKQDDGGKGLAREYTAVGTKGWQCSMGVARVDLDTGAMWE